MDFISDEDMAKLEDSSTPEFISDDEMAELEAFDGQNSGEQKSFPLFNFGMGALKILGTPGGVARTGLAHAVDAVTPGNKVTYRDTIDAFKGEAPTGGDYLERFGVPAGREFNLMPEFTIPETRLTPEMKLGEGKSSVRDMVGVVGDALTDPLMHVGKIKQLGSKFTNAAKESSKTIPISSEAGSIAENVVRVGPTTMEQTIQPFRFKAPKSLKELESWTPPVGAGELIGKKRLAEIVKIAPDIEIRPLEYQFKMLDNPKAMKALKLKFENLPTETAQQISIYTQAMLDEAAKKLQETVLKISGKKPRLLGDMGEDFIDTVNFKYNIEKEILKPAFERLKKIGGRVTNQEAKDLIVAIAENTKLKKLLEVDPKTGRYFLGKNKPRTGVSDAEYSVLSKVIDDLNDGISFKEIQRTRDYLRKQIDPINPGATPEIENVRKILLEQLEFLGQKRGEDVGSLFKKYAINERARENLEKIIGGKIETLNKLYAANPDKVVKKIFSNPNYKQIAVEYIGQKKVNEMLASYIQNGMRKAFDQSKGFNPNAARNWINENKEFLIKNVGEREFQRMSAFADYGQLAKTFLYEVNPSGTAASLKEMIQPGSISQKIKNGEIIGAVTTATYGKVEGAMKTRGAKKAVDDALKNQKQPPARQRFDLPALAKKATPSDDTIAAASIAQKATTKNNNSGPKKWAATGLARVQDHAKNFEDETFNSINEDNVEIKKLLIQASDLKPGSEAMKRIYQKIKRIEDKK
jgi:hypothetical protein